MVFAVILAFHQDMRNSEGHATLYVNTCCITMNEYRCIWYVSNLKECKYDFFLPILVDLKEDCHTCTDDFTDYNFLSCV
jgi:hypothetical protein